MMSYQDVMIICSDLPVGKPLCMHIGTAMVHLHIFQHPCQNPKYYQSSKPFHLFPNPFSVPVTYIYIYIYIYMKCIYFWYFTLPSSFLNHLFLDPFVFQISCFWIPDQPPCYVRQWLVYYPFTFLLSSHLGFHIYSI